MKQTPILHVVLFQILDWVGFAVHLYLVRLSSSHSGTTEGSTILHFVVTTLVTSYPFVNEQYTMFCAKCKKVLDLDILLGTSFRNEEHQQLFPHHESLAALARSAAEGCSLCRLVLKPSKKSMKGYKANRKYFSGEDTPFFLALHMKTILYSRDRHAVLRGKPCMMFN